VTSINNGVPFIAFINNGLHAGVASGGSWHLDDTTNLYVWDSVLLQDPISGPNQPYIPGQWTFEDIGHVISASASEEAQAYYSDYGARVVLRGAGGVVKPLAD
jgi:hypothetical protein